MVTSEKYFCETIACWYVGICQGSELPTFPKFSKDKKRGQQVNEVGKVKEGCFEDVGEMPPVYGPHYVDTMSP